jgi:hypothetical protein
MSEKRFIETVSTGIITDTETGKEYKCEMRIDDDFLDLVNDLAEDNKKLKEAVIRAAFDR